MGISLRNVSKTFCCGLRRRHGALDRVSFDIDDGEMVALIGPSGSGKSTLLRLIGGLIAADAGSGPIRVGGCTVQDDGRVTPEVRTIRAGIGMVFQQFNLAPRLPLITNVLVGMIARVPTWRSMAGIFTEAERHLAIEALERVGIAEQAWQRSSTLSGGQQQRAAIARALVQKARVILGDEPIASLDPRSCRLVMESFARINREDRATVVVSLHQIDWAGRFCPRTIALRAGRVVFDGPTASLSPARLRDIYGDEFHEAGGDEYSPSRPASSSSQFPSEPVDDLEPALAAV